MMTNANSTSLPNLPKTFTTSETWGFGLTGLSIWISIVVGMHVELGTQAIFVWIPSAIVGILINLQVKRLGAAMPDVSGGAPNYVSRLFQKMPILAAYGAIGYFLSWTSAIVVNSIILTDLIKVNLDSYGIPCPEQWLRTGLILLPFVVSFSGSRALSILHLFFVVPAVILLLLFGVQGLGWLAFSLDSPGLFPEHLDLSLSFVSWAKWFFLSTYATYACETASSFVADSLHPQKTLRFLDIAAGLSLPVFVGGSWVMARLATQGELENNVYLHLISASTPFWGQFAALIVTFLIASSCLLAEATAVSNSPRIIYQMSRDSYLAPVFSVVSSRGVFGPALVLILGSALFFLIWGHVAQIIVWGNVAWLITFILLHLGLWMNRDREEALFPRLSLGLFVLEVIILFVGGLAWGWQDFLGGILLPFAVMAIDFAIRRIPIAPFEPEWWSQRYRRKSQSIGHDSLMFQVSMLILLLSGSVLIGWWFRARLDIGALNRGSNLILVLLMIVVFVGVAIACWTSLPQVVATIEAREVAEQAQAELEEQKQQLQQALQELQQAQLQLVQNEKMSALGNLVAGVAHEINNPVGFLAGNLTPALEYIYDLFGIIELYEQKFPQPGREIEAQRDEIDLDYIREDLPKLIGSMKEGVRRIREISQSLRTFSRADRDHKSPFDIHEGLDSTLLILKHRLKANEQRLAIEVIREYGAIPNVECFPGQLNQVFMNILANAIDIFDEMAQQMSFAELEANPPRITIQTVQPESNSIEIRIRDNGKGMPEAVKARIFDHLFTTKAVGKGTGLGLAIARQIVEETHGGSLQADSVLGYGTEFVISLPIDHVLKQTVWSHPN